METSVSPFSPLTTNHSPRTTISSVILKWNPAISSYNMCQYLIDIIEQNPRLNWSVWEYDRVHAGDEFYMLKVGSGVNGIVAAGTLISEPYISGDWSRRGRKVYYSDYRADIMLSPSTFPVLTSSFLENEIPGFDWRKGHSGAVLEDDQAKILRALWKAHLQGIAGEFISRMSLLKDRGIENDQLYISPALLAEFCPSPSEE